MSDDKEIGQLPQFADVVAAVFPPLAVAPALLPPPLRHTPKQPALLPRHPKAKLQRMLSWLTRLDEPKLRVRRRF